MELHKILEEIKTKKDFLDFVEKLMADKIDEDLKEKKNPSPPYSRGRNGWENDTIVGFLASLIAYGEDSKMIDEKPNWKNFALLLFAGKIYE